MHRDPPDEAIRKVLDVIRAMSDREWTIVDRHCRDGLSAVDVERVVAEHGHAIMAPPAKAVHLMDTVTVETEIAPTWHVVTPLWTSEDERSDLSATMSVIHRNGVLHVELDDVRVR